MKLVRLTLLAAALTLASSMASAVGVRPLTTVYAPNQNAGTLAVSNTNKTTKTYQIFVDELSIVDGKQVRTPTKDLRFVPSIVTLQAGQTQTVRFLHVPMGGKQEVVYRIRVTEIPSKISFVKTGIQYALEYDFPWIWRAPTAQPQLSARWDGTELLVKNSGTATAQLAVLTAGKAHVPGLVGYVLPGEEGRFDINAKTPAPNITVRVNGFEKTLDAK